MKGVYMKKEVTNFKAFIMRGNVFDMAVGVIVGGAFGKIVASLVNDILMPLIGILLGGHDFSKMMFTIGSANIKYGAFLQNIVDFLIIAGSIYLMIQVVERITKKRNVLEEQPQETAQPAQEILLAEIRDLLKENKKKN